MRQKIPQAFVMLVAFFAVLVISGERVLYADQGGIESAICSDPKFNDIPVGQFKASSQMPEYHKDGLRITQKYNNNKAEGWDSNGQWMYGHDGIDIHEKGKNAGEQPVYAVQDGLVVVSHSEGTRKGWGESLIIATRTGLYSEQILTYHYHHLYNSGKLGDTSYKSSRLYNACDQVKRGYQIALEGGTGGWPTHLHLSVRRWQNVAALKEALKNEGSGIYGHGYSYGDDSKLANFLDPLGLLYSTFGDFQGNDPNIPYAWAQPYAMAMRWEAIEFGLFSGKFGADQQVARREAARWLKIAAKQDSYFPQTSTFPGDMPISDSDSCYVEAMARYPLQQSVVNPQATCQQGQKKFCPDSTLTRAQAIKMVVLAFYSDEYFKVYQGMFWDTIKAKAMSWMTKFKDVDPYSWYATYVYFGVYKGIVKDQDFFKPDATVVRAELAKWIMEGYWYKNNHPELKCGKVVCSAKNYCDYQTGKCAPLAICIPSETQQCEAGGGYDPCAAAGACNPGETQSQICGGGSGTQKRVCDQSCNWGDFDDCKVAGCKPGDVAACGWCGTGTCGQNGFWGACQNQGICAAGQTQEQSCNANGKQIRICDQTCAWGQWGVCNIPAQCVPNTVELQDCVANGLQGVMTRTCDLSNQWGAWGVCQIKQQPPPPQDQDAGAPPPQKVCVPGTVWEQFCSLNGAAGKQIKTCDQNGQWGQWAQCVLNQPPPPQQQCDPGTTWESGCFVNGVLGKQMATCDANGFWGAWGQCIVNAPQQCAPGATENQACWTNGQAGTATRTCDQNGIWSGWGQCIENAPPPPQKVCNPGATEQSACSINGQTGTTTRSCNANGQWDSWTVCVPDQQPQQDAGAPPQEDAGAPKDCNPGATQQQACNGGTQTRTCSAQGTWNAWGACVPNQPQCVCQSGTCCDGCKYYSAAQSCELSYTYQCAGQSKGDDAQKAMIKKFCTGNSADCTGQTVQYGWQTLEDCSPAQVCKMNGNTPQCVGACQDTYVASSKQACYGNPQGSGNPTLCLEIQNLSGSSGQYRLCKQGGTFGNNFTYQLKDDNNLVNFGQANGSAGIACTNWQNFSVNYIQGYGALNGAGLEVSVTSPAGCAQAACQYRTGTITISKSCL